MQDKKLSIIIPCYNERESLPIILEKVKNEIFELQCREVKMHELNAEGMKLRRSEAEKPFCIDQMCIYDDRFLYIRGWDLSSAYAVNHGLQRVAVLESRRKKAVMKLRREYRTDLAESLNSKESGKAGFSVLFDLDGFDEDDIRVSTGFMRDSEIVLTRRIYGEEGGLTSRIKNKVRRLAGR